MTKLFIFLFTLTIASIAATWFIDNDGSISIEWMGYHIQTSVAFSILTTVIAFIVLFTLLQVLIWFKNIPKNYQKSAKDKKREKGLTAITEGFVAIAAGDTKKAKKLTKQAVGLLGHAPVTRLLEAQSAQLDGNMDEAKTHYTAMLENKETEIIAIKGLLIQAEKDGDLKKAIFLAEKAVKINPNSQWANTVLLRLYKITQKWIQAQQTVQRMSKLKMVDSELAKHDIAVIFIAQSEESKEKDNLEEAVEFAKKAYKEMPDFSPAAIAFSKLLLETNSRRKAIKILEKCWKQNTNPQIASLYMEIFGDEPVEKRQKHADKLLSLQPNDINSHIAVADAAIAADNPSKARNHLKMALNIRETSSICKMMAEVERLEEAEKEVINKWLKRSQASNTDPLWGCSKCGATQAVWNINCNNCQSFDSLKWTDNKTKMNVINSKTLISS